MCGCTQTPPLFDMRAWERLADPRLRIEHFRGADCWTGIDLGFVDDIAAVVHLFKTGYDEYVVFGRYYLPEETIEESRNSQYPGWHRSGRLIATNGNTTDIDEIVSDLGQHIGEYNAREVAFDPYNKLTLLNACSKLGVDLSKLIEVSQTAPLMSRRPSG
jgi:phage terminase large subunit-like protein